jgi:hypothetical protein
MKPTYKSYAELSAAFKSGALDSGYRLCLDKGGSENRLRYFNPDESEEVNDQKANGCRAIFNGDDQPLEDVFTLAGIPVEWA